MADIDRKTVAGLVRGDDDAYLAVLKALKGPIYSFALRLCCDSSTAEDITQETFLAVWQSVGSFRWKSRFSTWVFSIAYRQHLSRLRKDQHTVDTVPLEDWSDPTDPSDLSETVAGNIEKDRVRRTVYSLPDPYREVVCLVHLEGFTCKEASQVLDLPIGTVKSRVSRALRILRERLGESEVQADE